LFTFIHLLQESFVLRDVLLKRHAGETPTSQLFIVLEIHLKQKSIVGKHRHHLSPLVPELHLEGEALDKQFLLKAVRFLLPRLVLVFEPTSIATLPNPTVGAFSVQLTTNELASVNHLMSKSLHHFKEPELATIVVFVTNMNLSVFTITNA
jgi:hypothetical protein